MPKFWKVGVIVVLMFSIVTGVILVGRKQNIFSKAYSLPVSAKSQIMYYQLKALYPQAEKISDQTYLVKDTTSQPKTFIFMRLTDVVPPTDRILNLWLSNSRTKIYSLAGTAETVTESNRPVSYVITVQDGLLENFDTITLSYDITFNQSSPLLPIINLKF